MLISILQKIPVLIVGILLMVGILKIYFRSKNVTKATFVKILKTTKSYHTEEKHFQRKIL